MTTIILTRLVPRYRAALFQRLHEAYGWIVTSASAPPNLGFDLVTRAPWLRSFPFRWPDPARPNRVVVPVGDILRTTGARAVIAEAALSMSSTWRLPLRRRFLGAPRLLFWSHGWNMDRGFTRPLDWMVQQARLVAFRLADGHVCYSAEGAEWLRRFLPSGRVFVVRNTIDIASIRERTKHVQPLNRQERGPHLLSVGRFTPDKRFDQLVRIFRALCTVFPESTLTIIGDGPARQSIEREAGDLLGRRVFLTGALYDEIELAAHFKAADLFVYAGAVGLAVNHALAYGLPVVAYDRLTGAPRHHPEIAYVVDGVTGWRVRPGTERAFLETLQKCFSGSRMPREQLASSLERYVRDNLLLDRMIEDFGVVDAFLRRRIPMK